MSEHFTEQELKAGFTRWLEQLPEGEATSSFWSFKAGVEFACQGVVDVKAEEGRRYRQETVTIKTVWNYVGQVEQLVLAPSGVMQHRVLNTLEAQTRAALVALGWTPPPHGPKQPGEPYHGRVV